MSDNPIAVMTDPYRIVVENAMDGAHRYGRFATVQEAEDYAMSHRSRLCLNQCIAWYVEHVDE